MIEVFDDEENTQSALGKQSSSGSGTIAHEEEDGNAVASDKDACRVLLSKLLLVLTIVASATGVAVFAYYYTSGLERIKFEKQVRFPIHGVC